MEIRRCMKCMHELKPGDKFCPQCGRAYGSWKTESFALKPGTILDGKYLVGEMLGQGGFGITYIGFDLLLEQKVAIKEYFPMNTGMVSRDNRSTVVWSSAVMQKTGAEKGFDSFLKEARKMARLGGIPGVVGVKSVFIQNETAYIVMDFVEGETLLGKLQREGPMDFDTCVKLLTPIMQALAEVHTHGIIHRDISPDNIMVRKDGNLVLLDLGAAKDLDIQGADGSVQSSQLVAKHGFSPIEQYGRNGKVGPWTDIYAMAATVYYCCTGVLPPAAVDRVVEDTLNCQPPLTKAQFNALASCMVILPEKRPRDMNAMLKALTGVPPKQKPPKSKPPKPEKPKPKPEPPKPEPSPPAPNGGKKKWLALTALAVCLLVIICISIGKLAAGKSPQVSTSRNRPSAAQNKSPEEAQAEISALVAAGTKDIYTYQNGAQMKLYFDDDDLERCRIFVDPQGQETFTFTASYDANGNIVEERGYEGQELMRVMTWAYNADGNELEIRTSDGTGKLLSLTEISYDAQGREISRVTSDGSGNVTHTGSSTYDSSGAETYTGVDANGEIFVRQCDADGNCLEYTNTSPDGKQLYRGTYRYDSDGREIEWAYYDRNDKMTSRSETQYDGDKKIREIYYYGAGEDATVYEMLYGPRDALFGDKTSDDEDYGRYNEEVVSITGQRIRKYSTHFGEWSSNSVSYYNWFGNITSSISYNEDGSLLSEMEYHYDEFEDLTGSTRISYNSNGSYEVSENDADYNTLSTKKYDANGKQTGYSTNHYDEDGYCTGYVDYDASGQKIGWTEYDYDTSGNRISVKNYGETGNPESSYEYHYDSSGKEIGYTSTYYSSDGSYRVVEYDADYNITSEKYYDAGGKLIKSE